jgi:hypothetical protein
VSAGLEKMRKNDLQKNTTLVTASDFLRSFPEKADDLIEEYAEGKVPKFSHRTLRYYVSKGLFPRPVLIEKKTFIEGSILPYKRLFTIWYLTHRRRWSIPQIRTALSAIKTTQDFDHFYELIERHCVFLGEEGSWVDLLKMGYKFS